MTLGHNSLILRDVLDPLAVGLDTVVSQAHGAAASWQDFRQTERALWDSPLKDHYSAGYAFVLSEIAANASSMRLEVSEYQHSLREGAALPPEKLSEFVALMGAVETLAAVVVMVQDVLNDVPMSLAQEKLNRPD